MKIALGDFKRKGGRFISINPCAPAIRRSPTVDPDPPGTDGALFMALLHELLAQGLVDRSFLQRFTNAPQLVVLDEGEREGLFAFDPDRRRPPGDGRHPHNKLAWDLAQRPGEERPIRKAWRTAPTGAGGPHKLADGTRVAPAFQLLRPRCRHHARMGGGITGIPAERIRQLAREWARRRTRPSNCRFLDRCVGQGTHPKGGRWPSTRCAGWRRIPTVSRRCALAVLMSVLGTIDAPGGFRHKAPYPPTSCRTTGPSTTGDDQPNTPLNAAPLGFPASPGRIGDPRRRNAAAHRPRVLLGAPAVGPRDDAQRHHQRGARVTPTRSTRC